MGKPKIIQQCAGRDAGTNTAAHTNKVNPSQWGEANSGKTNTESKAQRSEDPHSRIQTQISQFRMFIIKT